MWKHVVTRAQGKKQEGQEQWELQLPSVLEGETVLTQLQWGANRSLLAVNCSETVVILNEQVMNAHYNQQVSGMWNYYSKVLVCNKTLK